MIKKRLAESNIKKKITFLALGRRADRERIRLNKTIEELSKESKLNKNTTLRFFQGKGTKQENLEIICRALGTSSESLLCQELVEDIDFKIMRRRRDESGKPLRREYRTEGHGLLINDLFYRLAGGSINATVFEVITEGRRRSHSGEELLFCLTGTLGVRIDRTEVILRKGDAVFFFGTEPHTYYNAAVRGNGSWLFTKDDFKDAASFALKLMHSSDFLSRYLQESVSFNIQEVLEQVKYPKSLSEEIESYLTDRLNQLLLFGPLYNEKRFLHISLTQETKRLIAQEPEGEDLVRLNRLLFQEAYPYEIEEYPQRAIGLSIWVDPNAKVEELYYDE